MTAQLLVYEAAAPITHARHGQWSVQVGGDYSFSKRVNSVPLMAVEFPSAATEYAIVFGGTGDVVMPAVILGIRADENVFVADDGAWRAKYVPAFLRRYPFVFSSRDEGKNFTLCVDEQFPGFNQEGKGERLFGDDAKPTPYVEGVLKFLQQYQVEFNRTQAFCKKLKELNLLEPMQAQINLDSGEKRVLTGFSAISRSRLKTLPAETLAELVRSDEMELIYGHMQSMRNFSLMRDRLPAQPAVAADAQAAPAQTTSETKKNGAGKSKAAAAG